MKKTLMTMAAISALSIGAPAAAQYAGGNVQARVQQLQFELQAGVRSGAISRRDAIPLRAQLRQLTQLEWQYGRDGFSGRERADLQQRINRLRQHIRYADRADNGRYDRYGQNDRYDRYGQNDRYDRYDRDTRLDRNSDGWDDRDFDRDGRWDDDRDGDRYDQSAYFRVGQRMSSDFDALPVQYRSQYRDGDGSYYRYDNGNIYQGDARTNLILRIITSMR